MEITTELVKHLAELSRLEFTPEELENFKTEFSKTMEHIEAINSVNTDEVVLRPRVLNAQTELRPDEIKSGLTKEQVIKDAPESIGGSIVVPTVVENEWWIMQI